MNAHNRHIVKGNDARRWRFFVQKTNAFFQTSGRVFPWRKNDITPYEVWVSEVMLQQTQASRVVEYYTRFLKRFANVSALASASWKEMLPYWNGLGYYRRGRNMLETAKTIARDFEGVFPCEVSELERLPGVGEYTSRAVASFACGAEVLAWDTNFDRVLGRYIFGKKIQEKRKEGYHLERTLANMVRLEGVSFADFNAAVMDFGSLLCTKKPKCDECPLRKHCVYGMEGGVQEKQALKKVSRFHTYEARAFVILHENHTKYFSSKRNNFAPFILDPPNTDREAIKAFFETTYHLIVSVRPPKTRMFLDDIPTILVYAQILSGKQSFSTFDKAVARSVIDSWG
jgi:A/G-specific adenine glycosylase